MKIIKRLGIAILFLLSLFLTPAEMLFLAIRWIITGKGFYKFPLCIYILEGEFPSKEDLI